MTHANASESADNSQAKPSSSIPVPVEVDEPGTFRSSGNVILGTAIIHVCNNIGQWIPVRALLGLRFPLLPTQVYHD